MSFLKLNRPIVFFDTETTGIKTETDRIIEISIIKLFPDGRKETLTQRFNPEMKIPFQATQIHKITDQDVANEPTFFFKGNYIAEIFKNSDIACYNAIGFDYQILFMEFLRCNIELPFPEDLKIIDPMKIFQKNERRDLQAALKFYCNQNLENAHTAEADILATLNVLEAQIKKYNLSDDVVELDLYCEGKGSFVDCSKKFKRDEEGEIIFNFGKSKGKKALSDPGYLKWMLDQDFVGIDAKYYCRKLLAGEIK
ncbi:MAG: 3'-5' exonuclease [Bacteroidetes bacterium]|nr:3'-5' exonuclease [Bacteroidota bacterium]